MLCFAVLMAVPWEKTRLAMLTYNKLDGGRKSQMMMLFQLPSFDAEAIVTRNNGSLAAALIENPEVVLETDLLSFKHTVTKAKLELLDKVQYEAVYTTLIGDFKELFALFKKYFGDYDALQIYVVRPTETCHDPDVEGCTVAQ